MSKKIDHALDELVSALKKHAKASSAKKPAKGKVNSSTAQVRAAASTYAAVVYGRTGGDSPFADVLDPRLDDATMSSLKAERDRMADRLAKAAKKGGHVESSRRD